MKPATGARELTARWLGIREYTAVAESMRILTETRTEHAPDEIWLLEHPAVFTLGRAALREHLIAPGTIPVVRTDRGGQVTYHGPGQLIMYLLLDLRRRDLGIKQLVHLLEAAIIELLTGYGIDAERRPGAPGVYVGGKKIAALGLRVRKGCTYHGISLNVDMDLEPFLRINPCGYPGLEVTQLAALSPLRAGDLPRIGQDLLAALTRRLKYDRIVERLPITRAGQDE